MYADIEDRKIERQEDGREVFCCTFVVKDGDGKTIDRRCYRRHLGHAEIDQETLQEKVNEERRKIVQEARNRQRIDPKAIT